MQIGDDGFDPFTLMRQFAAPPARTDTIPSALETTRAYPASWTSERSSAVETEDEGSAPFDRSGRPFPRHRLPAVVAVSCALHVGCETLRACGIASTLIFVDLDLFFLVASAVLVKLKALTLAVRGEVHALPARNWAMRGEAPVR